MKHVLVCAALFVTAVACGGPQPSGVGDSGVTGVVVLGPTAPLCPSRISAEQNSCYRPVIADVRALSADNRHIVASARSDAQGRFLIHLSPGNFVIQAEDSSSGARSGQVLVMVQAHRFAMAALVIKTGLA